MIAIPEYQPSAGPEHAWAPYEPGSGRPWNLVLAGHLLRRGGFGVSWNQLQQAMADGPQKTADRLFHRPATLAVFDKQLSELGGSLLISDSAGSDESAELWLHRMQHTPYPFLEKMTLFWHNYFAIAGAQVSKVAVMEKHLRLLRQHALGRFDLMMLDMVRDPATLIAGNSRANRKAKPSLEFAAALLRNTVGKGSFQDDDTAGVARAFTGSAVLREEFQYRPYEHDEGVKGILGKQGNFNGEDALRILLAHSSTPRNAVRRLYRWLVSESAAPEEALLAPLANSFAKDFDIAKLAGTMLRSNLFFSTAAYRQRVKSPVEFALGLTGAFDRPVAAAQLHRQLSAIGQRLLEPPAGEGWPGGVRWLNSFTISRRGHLAASILGGASQPTKIKSTEVLLQGDISPALNPDAPPLAVAVSPEFQLA